MKVDQKMQKFKEIYGISDQPKDWRDSPPKKKGKFTSPRKKSKEDYKDVAKSQSKWSTNLRDSPEKLANFNFSL